VKRERRAAIVSLIESLGLVDLLKRTQPVR
jgi:hypothetical protein